MNTMNLYSTPIWQSDYPNFDEEKDTILKFVKQIVKESECKNENGIIYTGYKSEENIHSYEIFHPLFEYICQMVTRACYDLNFVESDIAITSSWLTVNSNKDHHIKEHVHKDVFSGVFYLKCPEGSGRLNIKNESINRMWMGNDLISDKNEFTASNILIEPVDGNILLFPSYLPHSVENNDSDCERISISFSAIALPKGSINFNNSVDQ